MYRAVGAVPQKGGIPSAGEMQALQQEAQQAPGVAFVGVCPQCAYLKSGSCVVCENGSKHPSCTGCKDGQPPEAPWYQRSEVIVPIGIAAATAAVSALFTAWVMSKTRYKRAS